MSLKAPWGAWCKPQPYNDGYIVPLGWGEQLALRDIDFEAIDVSDESEEPV